MNNHFNLEIQLSAFWEIRMADKNIKSHHAMLYINLLLKWRKQNNNPVLHITSTEMCYEANLGNRSNYFRYMRELFEWGYLRSYRKGTNGATVEMKFLYDPVGLHIVSLPRTKSS